MCVFFCFCFLSVSMLRWRITEDVKCNVNVGYQRFVGKHVDCWMLRVLFKIWYTLYNLRRGIQKRSMCQMIIAHFSKYHFSTAHCHTVKSSMLFCDFEDPWYNFRINSKTMPIWNTGWMWTSFIYFDSVIMVVLTTFLYLLDLCCFRYDKYLCDRSPTYY